MTNFDTAREALDTSLNSAGSAMKEHEKWQQSLEAQINSLKASWQSLSQAFLSSDFLKSVLDGVINLVDGLTKLIDTFGAFPSLMGTVATGMSLFKNTGFISVLNKDVAGAQKQLSLLGKSFKDISIDLKSNQGLFKSLFSQSITKEDISNIQAYNSLIDQCVGSQTAYYRTMQNSSAAAKNLVASANGGKVAMNGLKTATIGGKLALFGLEAAATVANAALTMGLSLAIQFVVEGIMKLVNANKELAESVEEITSKFKEQHDELIKLKGDYDTDSESSMISKYAKLSKGVDNLGRNVSLTADEYSEYQGIVNQIAEQIPSLVSGYDSQGNAILSCKGNVEELTEAYEKLIHAQNQEILTNVGNIEKDFANTTKDANGEGFLAKAREFITNMPTWGKALSVLASPMPVATDALADVTVGNNMTTDTAKTLKELLNTDRDAISDVIEGYDKQTLSEIKTALKNAGVDISWSDFDGSKALEETLKTDPSKIKGIVDDFYGTFTEALDKQKTIAQAKLSEAFDVSSAISGLDYGNISEELQAIAYQTVNSLDLDFFEELQEEGETVEEWTNSLLKQLNSISDVDNTKIEAAFDLQTQFNGGEVSYGEYVASLQNTEKVIDGLKLSKKFKNQLKITLGLDDDGVIEEYKRLRNRLANNEYFDIMPSDYEPFINSLSSEELSVLWKIIPEFEKTDYKETIADIKTALEQEMMLQGLTFDLNLEVETASIEAVNKALAESVSATGLSSESIDALKGRYADLELQGYDLSSMFEETSTGIRLNRQEFSKLEKAYATEKLAEIDGDLTEMKNAYDDIGEAIRNCDDPVKKSELFNDRQTLAKRISEAATLAHQYKGLTSAYNDWISAESAGQERDMYENIIKGFETVDDEISRGWVDDGTIEFLELLTGRTDLAGKSGKQLKEVYDDLDKTIGNSGYSIRDFFTVNEDGESTNTGVYNFLETIESFEGKLGDVIQRKDGNIVGFDFEVAGGDEVIAETLGISEELVQIMVRAADDAGFVVSMDGTYRQLADLQNEAKAAADYLHQIGKTDFEFDFNTSSVEDLKTQLEEAHKILDSKEFWNKDGTLNFNADGATQAMQVVSTLQAKLDNLTSEKYGIGLTVEDEEFEEPLEKLQDYGHKIAILNQLELNPKANAEEIEKVNGELDEIAEYFADLDTNKKIELGFEADDDIEDIKKKIESGEIKIPTVLDIQTNMDKNLETLADLALLNSGLLSESEEETIRKKYIVDTEVESNTPVIDEETKQLFPGMSPEEIVVGKNGLLTTKSAEEAKENRFRNLSIIADAIGTGEVKDLSDAVKDLDDKTIQAIAEVLGQIDVERLKQEVAKLEPKKVEAIVEAIGKGDVDGLKTAVNSLSPRQVQAIAEALGYDDVNELNTAIEGMDGNTVKAVAEALGITDVESLQSLIDNMHGNTVDAKVNTDGQAEKVSALQSVINGLKGTAVNITLGIKKAASSLWGFVTGNKGSTRNDSNGFSDVNGTAHVNGTAGRAFKQGSWGTKNSGTALVGELGREVLVRNGRYYTIGDNGAEFIKYQKGDIIFNHRQTEELFANGKVTANGGRGKAFADGTAFSRGSGGFGKVIKATAIGGSSGKSKTTTKTTTKTTSKDTTTTTTTTTNHTGGSKGGTGGINSSGGTDKVDGSSVGSQKDFEETFDWIAIAIERIEREIDNLDQKANNVYKSWSERNSALASEISKVSEEIKLQNDAAKEYLAEANAVGLTEKDEFGKSYAEKVREGTLDIEDFKGESYEALVEKIKEYQKWYELYLECTDAAEELKETEAELYAQRVENVSTQYEGILRVIEHEKNILEEYISQSEANAQLISANYYNALVNNENENLSQLQKQKNAMLAEMQVAMNSGTITKYSEAWYDIVSSIDEVTLSIAESQTKIKEWQQTIQQLSWETFDLLQEKISSITEEADFLIELLSSDKLFVDNGQLTDEGKSTMGLHGQNYNTYMYQADKAGTEAERLKKQLAQDPFDTELEARYREMIALQQEYILSAQQEKEAIRDLVREGIELELDSLQSLIDKKNEALESERDLYEYQKKVSEQTAEIASLEKQIASYSGDNSEEAKAKVQQLKIDLQSAEDDLAESEYDKYISDQSKLLDELYLGYEEILNTRLDNLDALVESVISQINTDATSISSVISEKADSVGYTLSDSMKTIWDSNTTTTTNVITTYGEKFTSAQTTTNNAISTINTNLQNMIAQLNTLAKTNVKSASISSVANSKQTDTPKSETTNNNKNNNNKNDNGTIKVGGKINAKGAQIYDYAGDKSGERQLYRNDPIYKVLKTDSNWLQVRWHKLSNGITGWFKKGDVKAYATGKKNFLDDEIAWTQENGQEFIIRPSDGAILTPVAKGDSILNAQASNNIWSMANSPAEFIKDNLSISATNVPNTSTVQSTYTQHLDKVVFNLPNVKNYDELLSAMQKDKNFERLITSMTIDQIAGKSSLAKGKSIR